MHDAPHARDLVLLLLALRLLIRLGRAQQLLEVGDDRFPALARLVLQQGRVLVHLVVGLRLCQRLLHLLDHLADRLVRLLWQQEQLQQHDDHGHDEVEKKETVVPETTTRLLEYDPVYEEQGAGGIESAGQESENQA